MYFFTDIVVSANESPYEIGSSSNITCSSDLSLQTIQWLNNSDDGRELFNNSGQQQLLLQIERVTSSLNNTMYTCEVQLMLAIGVVVVQENITVLVDGKDYQNGGQSDILCNCMCF